MTAEDGASIKRICPGCWSGDQQRTTAVTRRADGHDWTDCDYCGLPGPKPADYEWDDYTTTHYVNHGNTWQEYRLMPKGA